MALDNSLPRIIASQIASDIINGKLPPGQRVVEDRYAEDFGTSRAPVREALYLLTVEGLIERRPRRGAYVKRYTTEDIKDLYELRLSIEIMAINRITYPLDELQVEQINEVLRKMEVAVQEEDHESYAELNSEFHRGLIKLSQSEVFKNLYARLGTPLVALQKLSLVGLQDLKASIEDHKMLWNLLLNQKKSTAEAVLQDHNIGALRRISSYLDNQL